MANQITFDTAKSIVISLLQASRTAYATTVDGSKLQFASDTEIVQAILQADGEIMMIVVNTPGHPFQAAYVVTSTALQSGDTMPEMVGMPVRVTGSNGQQNVTITSVTNASDLFTVSGGHGLVQGQKIRFTNSGGGLPSGISAGVDYWVIYINSTTFKVASTPFAATAGTPVNLTTDGTGTQTAVIQYVQAFQAKSRDEVVEMQSAGGLYANDFSATNGFVPFFFIEGHKLYISSLYGKVDYTDFDITSTPLSPEQYTYAVCAGAVGRLLKDGGDDQQASYYLQMFEQHKQMVREGVRIVPAITAYTAAGGGQ